MIRKVRGGYVVVAKSTGRRLSKPTTKAQALKQLRAIEIRKRRYPDDERG